MARRLGASEVRVPSDPATLGFTTTAELPPLEGMIGQERAARATAFGMAMRGPGYNLFVSGPTATGKTTAMRRELARAARAEPTPADWCYVYDFADHWRPRALALPAGRARELRAAMARLVDECRQRVPRAFESEEFERQKAGILEDLAGKHRAEIARLDEAARAEGFAILRTPAGLALAPAPRGEPIGPEAFAALPADVRERFAERGRALDERLEATVRSLREHERGARERHDALTREVAGSVTGALVRELQERFAGIEPVVAWLATVGEDLLAHADEFRALAEGKPVPPFLPQPGGFLERYQVNVLVDRVAQAGAPVVFEPNPTHGNLLGRIEHRVHFGTLVSDFTLIKPGALHRANGGYLVLEAKDVLGGFLSWSALKRALKAKAIRMEEPLEELRMAPAATLVPEPIPLGVKVVLIGSPLLYALLHALDEDFRELFKVQVAFDDSLARTPESERLYARFVGDVCREEGLPPFSAGGVARVIEEGARLVAHQERLTARLGELLELIREAAFWAGQRGRTAVEADDVREAVAQRRYRANLVEERAARLVAEGTVLIATAGTAVGQVNGIAVMSVGDHTFGRPARITARTFSAKPGVVDVEREAKLGGPIHAKGVMILTGFLAGRYARRRPLALAAQIAFEQQYEEIEGDSASSAELYALLSSLADVPLAQGVAVTGSVNQRGEIQPVGAVNEKVEGFFDVCRARGLTGAEGVLVPAANVRHLMLREDVVEAVRAGLFRIYAVATVDEGLAVLTGLPAGEPGPDGSYPAESVNGRVERALAEMVERLRALGPS